MLALRTRSTSVRVQLRAPARGAVLRAVARARLGPALLAALALLTALLPVPATHAAPVPVLRVLSYNIHAGIGVDGRLDLARTASVIHDSGADVVAVQEVDVHWSERSDYADQAAELAELTGMAVFFAPIYDLDPALGHDRRRRFGVAILSRHPIIAATNHELTRFSTVEPGTEPAPAPGFAEVVLSVRGAPVHVYNTHLDYRPDPGVRERQVAETVRILDEDPRGARQVLLGDFNAEPTAPELEPLFARVRDAWGPEPGGFTYPADDPVKRIDYVTVAGPVRTEAASVLAAEAADHRPVFARLALC